MANEIPVAVINALKSGDQKKAITEYRLAFSVGFKVALAEIKEIQLKNIKESNG